MNLRSPIVRGLPPWRRIAAPIALAERERLTSAPVLLLCIVATAVEVAHAGSATSREKQR